MQGRAFVSSAHIPSGSKATVWFTLLHVRAGRGGEGVPGTQIKDVIIWEWARLLGREESRLGQSCWYACLCKIHKWTLMTLVDTGQNLHISFQTCQFYKGVASHDGSSLNAHFLDEMQKLYFSDRLWLQWNQNCLRLLNKKRFEISKVMSTSEGEKMVIRQ